MAGLPFEVEDVAMLETSPTGTVPALERGDQLISSRPAPSPEDHQGEPSTSPTTPASRTLHAKPSPLDDLHAASDCLARLKACSVDLDASIAPGDRSDLLAFNALVETALAPATYFAFFGDSGNFAGTVRPFLSSGLPWGVGTIEVMLQRRRLLAALHARGRLVEGAAPEDIYRAAAEAYAALEQRLRRSASPEYFFGKKPSTLDALLYGHLALHRSSTLLPPDLREQLEGCSALCRYLDRIAAAHFGTPALRSPADRTYKGTASFRGGAASGGKGDAQQSKMNRYWLMAAGGAVLAYLVLGGVISLDFGDDVEDLDAEAEAIEAESD